MLMMMMTMMMIMMYIVITNILMTLETVITSEMFSQTYEYLEIGKIYGTVF